MKEMMSARHFLKAMTISASAISMLFAASAAFAQSPSTYKLTTWNMAWLTDKQPGGGDVPDNVYHRTPADIALLAKYVTRLSGDIVAFQEVDGASNAQRVFDPSKYDIHTTTEPDVQRPGFAIRKGIRFDRHPDFAELDVLEGQPRSLRRGADITVYLSNQPIRMLAVHLKSGCPQQNLNGDNNDCKVLKRQLPILADWVARRIDEGVPFVVLGDFNRAFRDSEPFWKTLNQNNNAGLRRSTADRGSVCWSGKHKEFIDHIVFGGSARFWVVPDSFNVLVYDETSAAYEQRISDHCPQSVNLRIQLAQPFVRTW